MDGPRLSPETQRRLDLLFPPEQREQAAKMLVDECGKNLPFCEKSDEYQMERVRYAVLKLSAGDVAGLRSAIEDAKVDSRDVLMAAGFGRDTEAHRRWLAGGEQVSGG